MHDSLTPQGGGWDQLIAKMSQKKPSRLAYNQLRASQCAHQDQQSLLLTAS